MDEFVMTKEKFQSMYSKLLEISIDFIDHGTIAPESDAEIHQMYSLSSPAGLAFYNELTDEMLLKVLRECAKTLGTSPSQREIYWVWRDYIKQRFKKWPNALKAAGLPTSAGKNGMSLNSFEKDREYIQQQLESVKAKAIAIGRIPHPQDCPDICKNLQKYMRSWGQVIRAAGIQEYLFDQQSVYLIEDLEDEYKQMLAAIKEDSFMRGRAPLHHEVDREIKQKLIKRCSSWRNALYQIGLEPIMRITPFSSSDLDINNERIKYHKDSLYDCYYKVLNLTDDTKADLKYLQDLSNSLKRLPTKKDVSSQIVKRLIKDCGSWTNALFQLRYLNED